MRGVEVISPFESRPFPIDDGEVHVWVASLNPPDFAFERLIRCLSEDEGERAARFRSDLHRRHYIVARGLLRTLLGRYVKTSPTHLVIAYGSNDKPFLAYPCADPTLGFNLSHTTELAALAFVYGRDIGIDIERLRPIDDFERIADRFFAGSEKEALRNMPAEQRSEAFLRIWTRKEAYIKAIGDGLSMPLERFDVSGASRGSPVLRLFDGPVAKASQWCLEDFEPDETHVGALAIVQPVPQVRWLSVDWRCAGETPLV